jgi:hypothetical protein
VGNGETTTEIPATVSQRVTIVLRGIPDTTWNPRIPVHQVQTTIVFQGQWCKVDHYAPVGPQATAGHRLLGSLIACIAMGIAFDVSRPAVTLVNAEGFLAGRLSTVTDAEELRKILIRLVMIGCRLEEDEVVQRLKFESTKQFRRRVGEDKFKMYTRKGYTSINS